MTRLNMRIVGGKQAALTTTATIILSAIAGAAVQGKSQQGSAPTSGPVVVGPIQVGPQNELVFPYGIQKFEHMKPGELVTKIPGWSLNGSPGPVSVFIASDLSGQPRSGTKSRRWLCVEDTGANASQGLYTPTLEAPAPWDYAWSFDLRIDAAPAVGEYPVIAIQHGSASGFQDAWGIELTSNGARLFETGIWATAASAPIFALSSPTGLGEWIHIKVVASLEDNRLEAFVNGMPAARLGMNPRAGTDLQHLRLAYHGQGAGNTATVLLDDVGVAFLSGVCKENLDIDFTTDDNGIALVNGQDIAPPDEFGNKCTIFGAGPNNGAAIFDSSDTGPNSPSQDLDLLVNKGNVLILQNNQNAQVGMQSWPGIFDHPNDDQDGGTFSFLFNRPTQPLSIKVIDIDNRLEEGVVITETDFAARQRVYTVPANWTGDIGLLEPGIGTIDLTAMLDQTGPMGTDATFSEDAGFNPNAVVTMTVEMGGSGALDEFFSCIPCVEFTFDTEDDGNPDTAGTLLGNGQDISTPDEFGVEASISSLGPNAGAAIFDSTPLGPNDPGPDNDLLVGLGNILCLQNDLFATQNNMAGFFDTPNDDTNGGSIVFDFPAPVTCHRIDLIDIDEEEVTGATVILEDSSGDTRTYTAPAGWTGDILNDIDPGFRTLDLTTLLPQAGFLFPATAAEDPNFDPADVIRLTVTFGGAQDMDNLCFCP